MSLSSSLHTGSLPPSASVSSLARTSPSSPLLTLAHQWLAQPAAAVTEAAMRDVIQRLVRQDRRYAAAIEHQQEWHQEQEREIERLQMQRDQARREIEEMRHQADTATRMSKHFPSSR